MARRKDWKMLFLRSPWTPRVRLQAGHSLAGPPSGLSADARFLSLRRRDCVAGEGAPKRNQGRRLALLALSVVLANCRYWKMLVVHCNVSPER